MRKLTRVTMAVLALTACAGEAKNEQELGGGDKASTAAATAGDAGDRSATTDACVLITAEDLATVFAPRAFTVDTSGPTPRNRPGKAKQAAVTTCTFVSAGATLRDLMSITVMVRTTPEGTPHPTVDEMKKGAISLGLGAKPVDVSGLGDGAYWVNLGSAQRSAVAVNVDHGARHWLTVSESSSGANVDETAAQLTKLAAIALGRF